ncbi:hypothetical protein PS6_003398 [Mucor atramentarius]
MTKQPLLAKYWIESIVGFRLASNDLYYCLKDGFILCKVIEFLVHHGQLPDNYDIFDDNGKRPKDRINLFLRAAKDFGLQSSDLFTVDDLMNGENMNTVCGQIINYDSYNEANQITITYHPLDFSEYSTNTPSIKQRNSIKAPEINKNE